MSTKNRNPAEHGRRDAGNESAACALAWLTYAREALTQGASPSDQSRALEAIEALDALASGGPPIWPPGEGERRRETLHGED